jgi:hypothetical protein
MCNAPLAQAQPQNFPAASSFSENGVIMPHSPAPGDISRTSRARASVQSLSAVAGEIPRAAAASSPVKPANTEVSRDRPISGATLREELLDDLAADLAELLEAAFVEVGELVVA